MKQGLVAIMAALLLQGAAWAQGNAETALLDMREAYRRSDTTRLDALLPQVSGHALEPLARYWATKARLESAAAADIRNALSEMAGSYWEDRLRNDWLLLLGKNRDWATFEAELPRFRMRDDPQIQCYGLMLDAAARRVPADEAAQQVARLWLAQSDTDDGCATAAQAFFKSGHLPATVIWQRARLAMDANRPQAATQAVALIDPALAGQVGAIAKSPANYLHGKITALRSPTRELVTLAAIRLAASDLDGAASEMHRVRWVAQLSKEELSWIWGVIGSRAARKLQPDALTLFANGQDRLMNDDHLAWKARAALRAGAWEEVHDAIAAMSATQRAEAVWVYWQARALQALKAPDALAAMAQARELYSSIASTRGYYEQLALEALGRPVVVPAAPVPPSAQELDAARNNPGLQRALLAIQLGLRSEGVREWNYTVSLHTPGGMDERSLLAAARLACDEEVWDRCISTSGRTEHAEDFAQRFPMPHKAIVLKRASDIGIDPAYVYGLIRQESRFVTDARSGVGASGLMQVMPATARWTARRIGLTDFRPQHIANRDTNIAIGTAYLKLALDDFDGSLPLAAAAYNAGPGRSRSWREGPVLDGDIWIENIPFTETRNYVQRVLANTTSYAALLTGQPQSLRQHLGTIGPKTSDTPVNRDLP